MVVQIPELNELCINCLHNKGQNELCPKCGYDERKYKEHPLYLEPRTILKNQYVIGTTLGQGGFGITYIGQDLWLQKKVAIKEYLPMTLTTRDIVTSKIIPLKWQENTFGEGLQCFIEEARNLAKFDHPNIVRVINFFEENQTGYMVMDYFEGLSLADILNQAGGQLPVDKTLAIIFPILNALAEVHAQHIYHRDISIHNILILTSGVPLLIDFGAARHIVGEQSHTLDLVLKHGYSPLEQYSGKGKIGAWTDIYACGALLYLMITGRLPAAATDRFCEDGLVAPITFGITISTQVNNAIMRALTIKLEERFQTIFDFKAALLGTSSPNITVVQTSSIPKQNSIKKVMVIISVLLMISGGLFFHFNQTTLLPLEQVTAKKDLLPTQKLINQAIQHLEKSQFQAAYASYQKVLVLEFDNKSAQIGLKRVAQKYAQLSYALKGSIANRLEFVNEGLTLFPNHHGLLNLKQELNVIKLAHQREVKEMQQLEKERIRRRKLEAKLQRKIAKLLKKAENQLATLRLTTPNGDNAYETYQKILTLTPANPKVKTGLLKIADQYERLAHLKQNDLQKSLSLVNKGLKVLPTHTGLRALRQKIIEQHVPESPFSNPRQRTVAPSPVLDKETKQPAMPSSQPKVKENKQPSPQANTVSTTINNLLNIAKQHFETAQFEAAFQTYKNILTIDSDNVVAINGLQRVAHRYEQLARVQENLQKSLSLVEKGLAAYPTQSLLALQIEVTQRLNEKSATKPPQNIIFTPSF